MALWWRKLICKGIIFLWSIKTGKSSSPATNKEMNKFISVHDMRTKNFLRLFSVVNRWESIYFSIYSFKFKKQFSFWRNIKFSSKKIPFAMCDCSTMKVKIPQSFSLFRFWNLFKLLLNSWQIHLIYYTWIIALYRVFYYLPTVISHLINHKQTRIKICIIRLRRKYNTLTVCVSTFHTYQENMKNISKGGGVLYDDGSCVKINLNLMENILPNLHKKIVQRVKSDINE